MGNNSNNYIATDLEWTDYTTSEDLPVDCQLVFRKTNESLMFGTSTEVNGSRLTIVDAAFDFDRKDQLEGSQWASIDFVFRVEE